MNLTSHSMPLQKDLLQQKSLQRMAAPRVFSHTQTLYIQNQLVLSRRVTQCEAFSSRLFYRVNCSAFEQNVPLANSQGVWKQQLTPFASSQTSVSATTESESGNTSTALRVALELLKDIVEVKKGQHNDGQSVKNVVKLLQDFQKFEQRAGLAPHAATPHRAAEESLEPDPTLPVVSKLDGGSTIQQSAEALHPDSGSTAIQVLPQADKASFSKNLQQLVHNVLSQLSGFNVKSAGQSLGGIVLAAVLGGAGLLASRALPAGSLPQLRVAPAAASVPYSHFLSHINYDVVDEIEMVGHQLLYKLRDGYNYDPGAYQPGKDVMHAALAGIGNLLQGKGVGSTRPETLKTTLPVGHSLPLDKLVQNSVTLAAKQPGTLPKDAATILAALLAGYLARKQGGGAKEPQAFSGEVVEPQLTASSSPPAIAPLQPAVDLNLAIPVSTQTPFAPTDKPESPTTPDLSQPQNSATIEHQSSSAPNSLFSVLRWASRKLSSPKLFGVRTRDRSANSALRTPTTPSGLPSATTGPSAPLQSAAVGPRAASTGGEEVAPRHENTNPAPGASGVGEQAGDFNQPAPSAAAARVGQPTAPSEPVPVAQAPSTVNVTFVNTSAARVVLYAVNPVQDADAAGEGRYPPVAWKVFDAQQPATFAIGVRPPEVGAIRRESPTSVDRVGPFPTEFGAVWGLLQRSRTHTPMLKEGTPTDFWYRFRQEDAVTVVNVRPVIYSGRPYEFGYYQDGELLLLGQAVTANDYVRFQAPQSYTFAVLTSEAGKVRSGSLLDPGKDIEASLLVMNLREVVDKQVGVTLSHDPVSGYKWNITK